jgi:translation initiation factor IF-1
MAKEELIEFEGLVTEILPDTRYRVKLDTGHEIIAYTAGKMKKNRIKTLRGRGSSRCRPTISKRPIIFRHKDERASITGVRRCANSSAGAERARGRTAPGRQRFGSAPR